MSQRLDNMLASIAGIPRWVQGWLVLLVSVNMASLWFLDSLPGRWTALAFGIVAAVNVPMAWVQSGLTRLLSFTHIVWAPLLVYLVVGLTDRTLAPSGSTLHQYMTLVVIINAISLMFDFVEARRWWRGEREVLGLGEKLRQTSQR